MQLDYSINQVAGKVGAKADISKIDDVRAFLNVAAEAKFGCVATKGAAEGLIIHPDTAAKITDEKLVHGVVLGAQDIESKRDAGATPGYPTGSMVPCMRKGRVWILAEDTITEGTSTVNARFAASGGNTQLGALRGAADSSFTAVLPKSKWVTSTTGNGQLAILELDL